jgi:hypothetical protein
MHENCRVLACLVFGIVALATTPEPGIAQGKSESGTVVDLRASAVLEFSQENRGEILNWYTSNPAAEVESLPPGIRKRLARGKPLPPGIAKNTAPAGLQARLRLPDGYGIIEVGTDVLLVEIATSIVHDILMDAVR